MTCFSDAASLSLSSSLEDVTSVKEALLPDARNNLVDGYKRTVMPRGFVFDDTAYCVRRGAGLPGRLLFQDS